MGANVLDARSPVGRLTARPPVRVPAGATLAAAARTMREAQVSSALVGSTGAIVTERDLTIALASGLGPDDPVDAVASADPVRVAADLPVVDAAALMLNREIRHLVVLRADGSEAVISLRDLMAVLLSSATPELWLTSLRIAIDAPTEIWLG